MVCTFIPIKQSKNSKKQKNKYTLQPTQLQEKRDCYDEEYPVVAKQRKTNGSQELIQTNRDTPFSLLPSNEIK